jgi:AcrR family transcriptional regulator
MPEARDSRTLGNTGLERYSLLLDALEVALADTPWRKLGVPQITRDHCSPATFYQYFASIEDAFDVLMKRRADQGQEPTEHIRAIAELLRCEQEGGR